jgi:hypothetical protein
VISAVLFLPQTSSITRPKMSFFKKFGSEFEAFLGDKDKDKEKEKKDKKDSHGERSASDSYYGGCGAPSYQQPPVPYQQSPSPYQPYQQPGFTPQPPQQYAYGMPPPIPHHPTSYEHGHVQPYYAPPSYPPPPPGNAQLPPGWAARFDENYKSWYYINESTGVSRIASISAAVISNVLADSAVGASERWPNCWFGYVDSRARWC